MEDGCEKIFRDIIGNQFSSAGEDPSVIVQTANPVDRCVFPNGSEHFATDSESTRTLENVFTQYSPARSAGFLNESKHGLGKLLSP